MMIDLPLSTPALLMLGGMAVVAIGIGIIDYQAKRTHANLIQRRKDLESELAGTGSAQDVPGSQHYVTDITQDMTDEELLEAMYVEIEGAIKKDSGYRKLQSAYEEMLEKQVERRLLKQLDLLRKT